eukprot:INCI17246.4.p2 GENE.INCI17246.4~~INCI17246.4.p2  ORF type:complete len:124 (-),score=13.99 INCI17246.4:215-586(-)
MQQQRATAAGIRTREPVVVQLELRQIYELQVDVPRDDPYTWRTKGSVSTLHSTQNCLPQAIAPRHSPKYPTTKAIGNAQRSIEDIGYEVCAPVRLFLHSPSSCSWISWLICLGIQPARELVCN